MPKQPPRMGTCYVDTYRYFCYECDLPNALMVHGILHGRNDLKGWTYGHAWIELGDVVLQPVKNSASGKTYGLAFVNRKEQFYELYQVDESKLVRYSKDEALKLGVEQRHFGPWHELGLGDKGYLFEGSHHDKTSV